MSQQAASPSHESIALMSQLGGIVHASLLLVDHVLQVLLHVISNYCYNRHMSSGLSYALNLLSFFVHTGFTTRRRRPTFANGAAKRPATGGLVLRGSFDVVTQVGQGIDSRIKDPLGGQLLF